MILTSRVSKLFRSASLLKGSQYNVYPYITFGYTDQTISNLQASNFNVEEFIHNKDNILSDTKIFTFTKIKSCYVNRTTNTDYDQMIRNLPVKFITSTDVLLDTNINIFDSTKHTYDVNNQYYILVDKTVVSLDVSTINSNVNLIYVGFMLDDITYVDKTASTNKSKFYPIIVEYLDTTIALSSTNKLTFQYLLGV